ncbi:MAG: EAL domain-containing protein [Oscillospiraceae bacterium]|nr:EAL domain-containing protein [Oscillospiraceae bacterium]
MKLIILAEGVETIEQSLFLTEIGCDLAQGFYFSKPCPASQIRTLLMMPHYELKKQISK